MSIYGFRRRVVCYVTRTTPRGAQLLVVEDAEGTSSNIPSRQVPAGGMLPFESLEDAAVREVCEQTGVRGLDYADSLGATEQTLTHPGGPGVDNYVHLLASPGSGSSDSWEHQVSGERDDAGRTVRCRWEILPLGSPLPDGQGAFLDRLGA